MVLHFAAKFPQQLGHVGNVRKVRYAVERERLVGQKGGCHQRQTGVLGAVYSDAAGQPRAAEYPKSIHTSSILLLRIDYENGP